MARKSRKNMMPQAAVQEAVQQNEKELLRTAAYARLSVENGGHETEDSLHTQILQIHNYIRENPELTLTDTYADNGFTGTRFDRPEFERMMQDVRTGKIQCIVVKDLSRFGRDYIETGSYLETIFPMLHVRFIAINDDFDNIRQSDVDSLAVPIKNMVNSLYAKDISKKISLSYQMRREKGIPTSWCTPYGYQLNQQGNKLEALSFGKIFVGTEESLFGFWEEMNSNIRGKTCYQCNTPEEWIQTINNLANDDIHKFNEDVFELFKAKFSYDVVRDKMKAIMEE